MAVTQKLYARIVWNVVYNGRFEPDRSTRVPQGGYMQYTGCPLYFLQK